MYKIDNYGIKLMEYQKLCENNNKKIDEFINCICDGAPMKVQVDLMDVVIFMNGGAAAAMKMRERETYCRLCFEKVKEIDPASLNERSEVTNMVMAVFPEMDLSSTKNPVICAECSKNVTQQFRFKLRNSKRPSDYCTIFFSTSRGDEKWDSSDETGPVELNERFVQNCQKLAKILQGTDTPKVCNDFKFRSHDRASRRGVNLKECFNFKYLDNKKSIMKNINRSTSKTAGSSKRSQQANRSPTMEEYERTLKQEIEKEMSLIRSKIARVEETFIDGKVTMEMEVKKELQDDGERNDVG